MTTMSTEYFESKICGKIEKLNQLNYLRWVTRMRHHFTATQCLPIVLGEEPCPSDQDAHQLWIEKDGRAMGALLGACSQEMAIPIESSSSSADMWKILAGIANSADTETGRDLLFREFIDIKAIPGEPLSNFFGRLQETLCMLARDKHTTGRPNGDEGEAGTVEAAAISVLVADSITGRSHMLSNATTVDGKGTGLKTANPPPALRSVSIVVKITITQITVPMIQ